VGLDRGDLHGRERVGDRDEPNALPRGAGLVLVLAGAGGAALLGLDRLPVVALARAARRVDRDDRQVVPDRDVGLRARAVEQPERLRRSRVGEVELLEATGPGVHAEDRAVAPEGDVAALVVAGRAVVVAHQ